MNTVALQDFQSYAKVNDNVINKFKNKISETLLKIWQNYGLGTSMNGVCSPPPPGKAHPV